MNVDIFLIELKGLFFLTKQFVRHSLVPSPICKLTIHFRLFLPIHVSTYVIQSYERPSTSYNQKGLPDETLAKQIWNRRITRVIIVFFESSEI